MMTFPGRPLHTFFTSLSVVGLAVPGSTAITLTFFGVAPPTVTVGLGLMLVPVTSRKNCPVSCLPRWQLVTIGTIGVSPVFGLLPEVLPARSSLCSSDRSDCVAVTFKPELVKATALAIARTGKAADPKAAARNPTNGVANAASAKPSVVMKAAVLISIGLTRPGVSSDRLANIVGLECGYSEGCPLCLLIQRGNEQTHARHDFSMMTVQLSKLRRYDRRRFGSVIRCAHKPASMISRIKSGQVIDYRHKRAFSTAPHVHKR